MGFLKGIIKVSSRKKEVWSLKLRCIISYGQNLSTYQTSWLTNLLQRKILDAYPIKKGFCA
jgi:hypothetical protein